MRIAVTGSSGLVGQALLALLKAEGHEAVQIFMRAPNPKGLESVDGVVHLAGESIIGRWTAAKKNKILSSRVEGTGWIAGSIAGLERPPKVLVSASAIGFYGDRGEEILDESSKPGKGFLSEVCQAWEAAAAPARKAGIRTVHLRFGMILSAKGGALAKMLLPFRLGVGGVLGTGRQYMSWVTIEDAAGVILYALTQDKIEGPVNAVSPAPVTNREFTKALGKALHRPTLFPVPAFGARMLFGEMADALLLSSVRVQPKKLQAYGYPFKHPTLHAAMEQFLLTPA